MAPTHVLRLNNNVKEGEVLCWVWDLMETYLGFKGLLATELDSLSIGKIYVKRTWNGCYKNDKQLTTYTGNDGVKGDYAYIHLPKGIAGREDLLRRLRELPDVQDVVSPLWVTMLDFAHAAVNPVTQDVKHFLFWVLLGMVSTALLLSFFPERPRNIAV